MKGEGYNGVQNYLTSLFYGSKPTLWVGEGLMIKKKSHYVLFSYECRVRYGMHFYFGLGTMSSVSLYELFCFPLHIMLNIILSFL